MKFALLAKVCFFLSILSVNYLPGWSQQKIASDNPVFVLKGNTKNKEGKGVEGVIFELKKNKKTITKIVSGTNGKYSLQMDVSTIDSQNEYTLTISKYGFVSKLLIINTYISKEEYEKAALPSYYFELAIQMTAATGVADVAKPSGRIFWDSGSKGFAFDQTFSSEMKAGTEAAENKANPQAACELTISVQSGKKPIQGMRFEVINEGGKKVPVTQKYRDGSYLIRISGFKTNEGAKYTIKLLKREFSPGDEEAGQIILNSYIPLNDPNKANSIFKCSGVFISPELSKYDVILDKPSGSIFWDDKHGVFVYNGVNANVQPKWMKEKTEIAKKKAEEEAKLKAAQEARAISEKKRIGDTLVQEDLRKMQRGMKEKRKRDSVASISPVIQKDNASNRNAANKVENKNVREADIGTDQLTSKNNTPASSNLIMIAPGVSAFKYGEDTINAIDIGDEKQGRWINFGSEFSNSGYAPDSKYFEGIFENNQRTGDWVKYTPEGEKAAKLQFDNGMFTGNYKFFYENGNLFQEHFKDNRNNGETERFREYSAEGDLRKEFQYDSRNRKSGLQFVYYSNSTSAIIANMVNDTLQGYTNFYLEDGQSYLQQLYNKGVLKSEKYFGDKAKFPDKLKEAFKQLLDKSDVAAAERLNGILTELSQTDSQYRVQLLQREDDLKNANMMLAEREKDILLAQKKLSRSELANQLTTAEVSRQRIVIWSVVCGLLLVALLAGFVFRSLYVTRKQKQIIEAQKEEVERSKIVIEEKNKDITDSINYARRIQRAMLPHRRDIWEAFPQSFVLYKPKDIVSGDFYFFAPDLKGGKANSSFFISACDCTGHGVPGAFMSMVGAGKLTDSVAQSSDTSEVLSLLNIGVKTALKQSEEDQSATRDGMDIALCSVDMVNRVIKYAGANRPIWIIRKGSMAVEEIKATKKAIGGFTENSQHFDSHEIKLQEGDTFYLSTDGYADTFGKDGKKMMTKRFKEILLSIQDKGMKEQEKHLDDFVENWKSGAEQVDDILVIGIRV